jgi:hypothetical protein
LAKAGERVPASGSDMEGRLAAMVPRTNRLDRHLLGMGVLIVHFPLDVGDRYRDHPARARVLAAPPEMPPYVSDDQGAESVISYIEKFWCPTVSSEEMLRQ